MTYIHVQNIEKDQNVVNCFHANLNITNIRESRKMKLNKVEQKKLTNVCNIIWLEYVEIYITWRLI